MNIRRINLSARLHTNETYESYFKRRVAAIVSTYCEQQTDECMTTTLRLKKVITYEGRNNERFSAYN